MLRDLQVKNQYLNNQELDLDNKSLLNRVKLLIIWMTMKPNLQCVKEHNLINMKVL
jgi:hypothetical protein